MISATEISRHVQQAAEKLLAELSRIESRVQCGDDQNQLYFEVAAGLDGCLAELTPLGLWGPENRVPSSELWNLAGDLLVRGWLQNQARTKPRGYAGDYQMLARIYESGLCDDPLGRLLDRYFQEQAAPRAVGNRMRMMATWIVEAAAASDREVRVAIVGSAFGLEVRDALLQLDPPARHRVHVTLLDVDPAAIEYAGRQLAPLLAPERLTASGMNIFRLPERPQNAALLAGSDLLFCPGLFDYLDYDAAAAMLRTLYEQLAPGGRLTVFQFAPHNPTRAYMEWLGNWYLIYRDVSQLRAIVAATGIAPDLAEFGSEPLGIDLYVTIRRGGTRTTARPASS